MFTSFGNVLVYIELVGIVKHTCLVYYGGSNHTTTIISRFENWFKVRHIDRNDNDMTYEVMVDETYHSVYIRITSM